jgi:YVTN family beta-propeller protein
MRAAIPANQGHWLSIGGMQNRGRDKHPASGTRGKLLQPQPGAAPKSNSATTYDHKEVVMKSAMTITASVNLQPTTKNQKTNAFTTMLAILVAMAITLSICSVAQDEVVTGTYQNPLQLALSEWYPANQTAVLAGTYYGFSQPGGMIFDGSNIWVEHVNGSAYSVDKIQVSDNKKMGTFALPGASLPSGFDGVNVWMADHQPSSNKMYLVPAATGLPYATACTLQTSSGTQIKYPNRAVFDGKYMWVSTDTDLVAKVAFSTNPYAGCSVQCVSQDLGDRVYGLAYDGANIWATTALANTVVKLNSDSSTGPTISVPGEPIGITFDGTYLWTANFANSTVSQISRTSNSVTNNYNVGSGPWWIAYDGQNVWTTNYTASSVSKVPVSGGAATTFPACGSGSSTPLGVTFDGAHVWVGCEGINALGKM